MDRRITFFLVVILGLAVWNFSAWRKVGRRTHAFFSLLFCSVSFATYIVAFAYAVAVKGFASGPQSNLLLISYPAAFLSILGFGFGVSGLEKRVSCAISAMLLAAFTCLLWVPALLV